MALLASPRAWVRSATSASDRLDGRPGGVLRGAHGHAAEAHVHRWCSGVQERHQLGRERALVRLTSGAREDDESLGRSGHRDIAVDRSFDALAERLWVDEDDQVELEPLR
jgi:hypothetical protein